MMDIQRAIKRVQRSLRWAAESNDKEAIEDLSIALKALKKQIPMKPIAVFADLYDEKEDCPIWLCSICGKEKGTDIIWDDYPNYVVGEMQPRDQGFYGYNYCPECGQKIKWENE